MTAPGDREPARPGPTGSRLCGRSPAVRHKGPVPAAAPAGKTQPGVIEVNEDTMKGALKAPGDTVRPTDFTPQEGVIMFVAKRKVR